MVAKFFVFQLVNFYYYLVKNYKLNSEKRTRWIVRVEQTTHLRPRDQTKIGTREY